jgi:hypothetical protein
MTPESKRKSVNDELKKISEAVNQVMSLSDTSKYTDLEIIAFTIEQMAVQSYYQYVMEKHKPFERANPPVINNKLSQNVFKFKPKGQ